MGQYNIIIFYILYRQIILTMEIIPMEKRPMDLKEDFLEKSKLS